MASAVNNLRVNGKEVKGIFFKTTSQPKYVALKEFYYNGVLVWKNANPFIFVKNIADINLKDFGSDTLIFENFSENQIRGSYNLVEDLELEKPKQRGQMVVKETTEGEKK